MIDDHCHPFATRGGPVTAESLSTALPLSGSGPLEWWRHRLLADLATFLGCTVEDVSRVREAEGADWPAYVRRLLDDAAVDALVMEVGSQTDGRVADEYAALTDRPVAWLSRIDPFLDDVIAHETDLDAVRDAVATFVLTAVDAGCAGFKSAIAYRTGLEVDPGVSVDAAAASLRAERRAPVEQSAKAARDLVLRDVLALCVERDRPLQIHTGQGDGSLRLRECDPLLLEGLLATDEGSAATIVLIHGSVPWTGHLAALAMARPNVVAELSLANLVQPRAARAALTTLVTSVAPDRIVLGTDGHDQPETIWFAARELRRSWEWLADDLAAETDEGWLTSVRRAVFEDNARRIYGV
jgi:predicted TIM-barrel fold metal-dependent hydrolase